jgi:phytoene dehydrogenase-like protein
VLEARDRLGGRVHTADVGGTAVDLGGAWIHGNRGNPVAALAGGGPGEPAEPLRLCLVSNPWSRACK